MKIKQYIHLTGDFTTETDNVKLDATKEVKLAGRSTVTIQGGMTTIQGQTNKLELP